MKSDYYNITEVKWKLASEEIKKVTKDENEYHVDLIDFKNPNRNFGIVLTDELFELFKNEFPEHCIDIENVLTNNLCQELGL